MAGQPAATPAGPGAQTPPAPESPGFEALYLHIPFCAQRCRYCDFTTAAIRKGHPLIGEYLEALLACLSRVSRAGLLSCVRTAYIGGGTPTMLGEGLVRLVAAVQEACPSILELSFEANPESLTPGLARDLSAAGATRVSLGVQSLVDAELRALGRIHDAARARDAAGWAVDAGLDLSCDLMCGIPLQTPESFDRSLAGVLAAGAGHVSVYPLMVEEGTPLAADCERGDLAYPDEDLQASLMEQAARTLGTAGLSRYEVASYALPGKSCAHNVAYWTGRSYLGLGTGASSMMTPGEFDQLRAAIPMEAVPEEDETLDQVAWDRAARVRLSVCAESDVFAQLVRAGQPVCIKTETLSAREALAEDLMLGMRMTKGVPAFLLDRARGLIPLEQLDKALNQVVSRGLAFLGSDGGLVPTQQGWLLGNELYGTLWDLAHGG